MKKTLTAFAVGLAAALATPIAGAALSVADLSTPGDGLLTVDSASGLAWLDLTSTRGMSLNQVASGSWAQQGFRVATAVELNGLMAQGTTRLDLVDWLGGWAALPEISAYAGGPTTILAGIVVGDGPHADGLVPIETWMLTRDTRIGGGEPIPAPEWLSRSPWIDGFGVVGSGSGGTGNLRDAVVGGPDSSPTTESLIERIGRLQEAQGASGGSLGSFLRHRTEWVNPQAASEEWGVFLVKNVSAVPEPDTLVLMGVGLFGLFTVRKRRAGDQA